MAANGKAPRINARRSIAELEAELQKRTAERDEALEQQTATAQVLQVINSSPGDLAPVFDAILEQAVRLCGAAYGTLLRYDSQLFSMAAAAHPDRQLAEQALSLHPFPPARGGPLDRIVHGEAVTAAENIEESAGYRTRAEFRDMADRSGYRSLLNVALRKEGTLLGAITVFRKEAGTFSEQQIALLQNFASQAVIAMENARLITETREALEQQTATAEVLGVINSSPGDLAPVFEAMLEKATRLCEAPFGIFRTWDGERFHFGAVHGDPRFCDWVRQRGPIRTDHDASLLGRIQAGERVVHIADARSDEAYRASAGFREMAEASGIRSAITVALYKDEALLGIITVYRQEVRPFSDKQIALLQNFAAQAVIAMENARLITETREALEQQTATAEVLGVINNSPGDLAPVFDAMLEKAVRLCDAAFGILWTYDGDHFHAARLRDVTPAFAEFLREPMRPVPGGTFSRLLAGEPVAEAVDIAGSDSYRDGTSRLRRAFFDLGGAQTALFVALRKDQTLLGAFTIYRKEVRPFTGKQTALVASFAAQAVIAMENARLITETREALEQQTATAEVLQVINSSPGELVPVFEAMLDKAIQLCEATFGILRTWDGERFHFGAGRGATRYIEWAREAGPVPPYPSSPLERIKHGERIVHVADIREEEVYRAVPIFRESAELRGVRSQIAVALVKDNSLLGAMIVYRQEVRPFSDKQVALLENFAAQAVIAMENARLLGELRQRTDEVAELNRGLEARVAEQVDELGRVGRLKRFLAPQLAELIVSHGDEKILESHRREIVVVFCDLRGYTAFTETAEPEEVLDFLREYHGALGPLVSQFEGTLDQFSGDGIMVFFNDPLPIPDPAERAVNMAMAMREEAGKLIAIWRERGRELGFGVGIAQGYATLGQIGFADRSGYTAIGTVCNVAARLCAEAKNGQILLSQRVNAALAGNIATEELGALALKGLTQPVIAFNVPVASSANVVTVRPERAPARIPRNGAR